MLFAQAAIPQGLKAAFILRFIVGDESPTYQPRPMPTTSRVRVKSLTYRPADWDHLGTGFWPLRYAFRFAAIPQGLKAAFILRFIVGDESPTYQPLADSDRFSRRG
jgi:hypothetical protein